MRVTVNGKPIDVSAAPDDSLLRAIRERLELTGTKVGEVGLPPTGGAIGNAVAALTGVRMRRLPVTPERVLAALRERA
jgi:hypothetical protein